MRARLIGFSTLRPPMVSIAGCCLRPLIPKLRLVASHRAALDHAYRVVAPQWPAARIAGDKRLTHEHAAAVGVASPWSFYPSNRDEVAAVDCRFPVILKPTVNAGRNAFTAAKAWRVDDRAALLARYDQAVALVEPNAIMLQELVPGAGTTQFSYAAVWSAGEPVASLVARRTRQYPVDFGFTSTFVETIEQAEVEDASRRFLAPLRYDGLVEIEFKRDDRDGSFKLLDVNPRPWTWIGLGAAAGVDFPLIQWRLAMGERAPPQRGRAGVGWCHAARDFVSACQQIAGGTLKPRDYATSLSRPMVFAAFAADDPLPGIVDLPLVLGRVLSRRWFDVEPQRADASAPRAKPFVPLVR